MELKRQTVEKAKVRCCPDCGTAISSVGGSEGLCPSCLMELALESPTLLSEFLDPGEAPTLGFADHGLIEGQVQGERYRIRSLLGRGGMGEVWRAYDLKLRQDVAIKSLRRELLEDPRALETLRQEVRAAREVISPNVCRVFDLQELDGQELVSMEYIDGVTLHEILVERSPLELDEAREIASQFLAGLEAIHDADLVHQDIKPENIMVTRTGRVVVMDFGLAKGLQAKEQASGSGQIAGTPAYMSPEQSGGGDQDTRSDVYSAGVVLAEMVAPGGIRTFEERRRIWEGIHRETPEIAETPWTRVIGKAVENDPGGRFDSAAELARALEEVTLRAIGDETARPYPGLSAFQLEDAEYFFGRELEVEALWKKLRRPHLLAVIGPSGAGKSSFLRAGLLPTLTDGWSAIVTTPGTRPFASLARALASELTDSANHTDRLLRFEESSVAVDLISEWRSQHDHALIILDQFEELFTQNPNIVQQPFAELLGRLPIEADVHVLLAMRDDFLFHCHRFEAFQPILSDLTLLGPPTGASLRRAIVQPALKCGYRFEDESLVEAMLGEVEGERGSLPMVAFAAAKLWESRDRETGVLTQKSYQQIGGVGGALAQHAEATLDQIGEANIPIVRELFRNLVTAQGTRAARDREELLSVFGGDDPELGGHVTSTCPPNSGHVPSAANVLDTLIDARLLTSYEVPPTDDQGSTHHRIEIIHESLLSHWPRLVRWQTQDAEGAQLRDELRHQARLWVEKDRPDDLLWSGTSFKEYELWRERYEGGLSGAEKDFGDAMVHQAQRQKRRRRIAMTVVVAVLTVGLAIVGGFWRQAEQERRRAIVAEQKATTEAIRAEASKLLALGQLELDRDPTVAVAYALASLELADSAATRRFALEALSRGPAYFSLPPTGSPPGGIDFSPDERWLAVGYGGTGDIHIWSRAGGEPIRLEGHGGIPKDLRFSANSNVLVSASWMDVDNTVRIWSVPEGRQLLAAEGTTDPAWRTVTGIMPAHLSPDGNRLITYQANSEWTLGRIQAWTLDGAEPQELGVFAGATFPWAIDPSGRWLLYGTIGLDEGELRILPVSQIESADPRVVTHYEKKISDFGWDFHDQRIVYETDGEIRILSIGPDSTSLVRTLRAPATVWAGFRFDESGSLLAAAHDGGLVSLWDLNGPAGADPLILKYPSNNDVDGIALQASGRWLAATNDEGGVRLWPLRRTYPWILRGHRFEARGVAFAPDGTWIASQGIDGYRYWPLTEEFDEAPWEVPFPPSGDLAFDPAGRFIVIAPRSEQVRLLPLGGGRCQDGAST